jgi:hypothetical protein
MISRNETLFCYEADLDTIDLPFCDDESYIGASYDMICSCTEDQRGIVHEHVVYDI